MKITQYDPRKASSVPKKMSLHDPYTGVPIKDDDGKTVDFYVYGMQSDQARNAQKQRDRRSSKKRKDMTEEESTRIGAEFLAALTQGWSSNLETDDGPLPFTFEHAVQLYTDQDWIAQQVLQFASTLENYDPFYSSGYESGAANLAGSTPSRKGGSKADSPPEKQQETD